MPSETFELKVKPTQNAFLFTSTTLTTLAPSIWYLHFHKYPHFHKKNKDAYIYSTQIPHTKMYIQQFCPLSLFSSKDQVCTYISLCRGDTRKCKNKKFLFLFWVVMKTQPCSVNLLYPRLTGTAFMCKLRPLDDNPIEHTGLQYAKLCSNTESRLCFCHLPPLSLSCSLSASAITISKQGPSHPISILVMYVSVSHIYSWSLKAAMISPPCPWQWITLHLTSRPAAHCKTDLSRA